MNRKISIKNKHTGFTLIEMMVAVALFSVVMLVSVGSLLSLIDASKRAQGIQSVMNNLNVALDGMVRGLRMGQKYEVTNRGHTMSFTPFGKDPNDANQRWEYSFVEDVSKPGEARGRLYKRYHPIGFAGSVNVPLTASEVDIDTVQFYKTADTPGDLRQPRVVMIVRGKSGFGKKKTTTHFNIQASATQRLLDL